MFPTEPSSGSRPFPSYGRLFAGWEMAVEEKEPPEYLTPAQLADPVLEFPVVEDIALRARTIPASGNLPDLWMIH